MESKKERSAFDQALLSVTETLRKEENIKSRFYQEVLNQASLSLLNDGSANQAKQSASDFEAFVQSLDEEQQRTSRTRKISHKLKPLVAGLWHYLPVADTMFQASPDAGILLYGGAKLVLTLAKEYIDCFDLVLDTMKEVGHLIEVYDIYAGVYESSEGMQSLLISSYKNILLFWRDASRLFEKKSRGALAGGLVKPFTLKWNEIQKKLLTDVRRVKELGQATKDKIQKEHRKESDRVSLIRWIIGDGIDPQSDIQLQLARSSDSQSPGTCKWLLEGPTVQEWLYSHRKNIVWLHGRPGAGKSVACSALINHLRQQGLKIAYFFCSFQQPSTNSSLGMIKVLIIQLLQYVETVPDGLTKMYNDNTKTGSPNLQTIETALKIFEIIIKQIDRVHIVVDGHDELKDHSDSLVHLNRLLNVKSFGLVRWFCSSQFSVDYSNLFSDRLDAKIIELSQASSLNDIRTFLLNCTTTKERGEKFCDEWAKESEGNFLWIGLRVRILAGHGMTCQEDIDEALQEFPRGLDACYMKTLLHLFTRSEQEQNLAKRLFTLILCSYQPMTMGEIQNALAARSGSGDHSDKKVPPMELLERFCFPLFVIFKRDAKHDEVVVPVHKTVRDFLLHDPSCDISEFEVTQTLSTFFQSESEGHKMIGEICLTYLFYDRYSYHLDLPELHRMMHEDSNHAFLRYAAVFGNRHLYEGRHTQEMFNWYRNFIRSSNFWTIMQVQSILAPHLFMRLLEVEEGYYIPADGKLAFQAPPDRLAYAAAIPLWLDLYGQDGKEVVFNYMQWAKEWNQVIRRDPMHIRECDPASVGIDRFFDDSQKRRISTYCLSSNRALTTLACIVLGHGIHVNGSMRWKRLKGRPDTHDDKLPNLRASSLKSLSATLEADLDRLLRQGIRPVANICSNNATGHSLGLLPSSCSVTESFETLDEFPETLIETLKSLAAEVVKQTDSAIAIYTTMNGARNDHDSAYCSNSDDDSDDDSDDKSPRNSEESPRQLNCVTSSFKDGSPFSYVWNRDGQTRFKGNCIPLHTVGATLWSMGPDQIGLCLASGEVIIKSLQQAEGNDHTAIIYDLSVSPGADVVDMLILEVQSIESDEGLSLTQYRVSLNSIRLAQILDINTKMIQPSQHVELFHKFLQVNTDEQSKVFISWTDSFAHILLPPLNYSPKIIRLPRSTSFKTAPETTQFQAFLPSSTFSRRPQFFVHDYSTSDSTSSRLTAFFLVLSAPIVTHETTKEAASTEEASLCPGPVLMQWSAADLGGWRLWAEELDVKSTTLSKAYMRGEHIKGSFAAADQRFCVPVRSGLNWTKKSFLSCW